uniref:NON-CATALYTIC PROTEIN 1 n=1 Tax=Piromyces equi TaxID=99929 RepID=UPI00004F8D8A|nr:Chain A, NON-CATALYTIC PROTEIN 1 [Piromyces sp. 'equi']
MVSATYSVVYETGKKLNSGFDNWGWDSKMSFKDNSLVLTADPDEYGAISLKNLNSNYYGKGGCIYLQVKTETEGLVKVQGVRGYDETEAFNVGSFRSSSDFTEYKFEVDDEYQFDRIIVQDGPASNIPIYMRYIIYSTGSCDDHILEHHHHHH